MHRRRRHPKHGTWTNIGHSLHQATCKWERALPGRISGWVYWTDGSDVDLQQSTMHATLGYTPVLKTLATAVDASAHHHTPASAEGSAHAPVPLSEWGLFQQPHSCDRPKIQGQMYLGILTNICTTCQGLCGSLPIPSYWTRVTKGCSN